MGIAAYNRGSKAIGQQIDAEVAKKRPSALKERMEMLSQENTQLKGKVQQLEQELERARKYYRLRRSERDAVKWELEEKQKEVDERQTEIDRLTALLAERREEKTEIDRRWKVCSHILREMFTDEQIEEFKQDVYRRYPHVKRED